MSASACSSFCPFAYPVPVLRDNYAWLLSPVKDNCGIIIIDPGEAAPVKEALERGRQTVSVLAILLTHHHSDHVGGANDLARRYHAPIYGPEDLPFQPDYPLKGGEKLVLGGTDIEVLSTPGHTRRHLSYYVPVIPALFSGDTLFSGGCGRLFEGTARMLFESLRCYDALPDDTLLCAGHEYTQDNLAFIASLQPENRVFSEDLEAYSKQVSKFRRDGKPSLPVRLGTERQINPFLRAKTVEELARLRHLKDIF